MYLPIEMHVHNTKIRPRHYDLFSRALRRFNGKHGSDFSSLLVALRVAENS